MSFFAPSFVIDLKIYFIKAKNVYVLAPNRSCFNLDR